MVGKRKKLKDLKGLPIESREQIDNNEVQSVGVQDSGLNGQNIAEPVPLHNQTPSETVRQWSNIG